MWANIFVIDRQILWNVETEPLFSSTKKLRMLSRTIWGQQPRSPYSALNCLPVPINALRKCIDSWLRSFCYYKTLINLLSSGTGWLETFPGLGSVMFVYRMNCVLSFVRWALCFFFLLSLQYTRLHCIQMSTWTVLVCFLFLWQTPWLNAPWEGRGLFQPIAYKSIIERSQGSSRQGPGGRNQSRGYGETQLYWLALHDSLSLLSYSTMENG